MGKDKFGAKRGMCALCECKEYTKPSNESQNCDYCDHKPVYHIEVISLGTCSCTACSVYTSSKEFEYDECGYCGCPAQNHIGWDKVQMEVEKIKYRFAKPAGAIESIVTKPKSGAFEKYYELEKFQREVTNAKSQVRAKFEYFRNCLNSIENEKICELDVISAKYEELFSYHQANLFEMEIVKSRISKFKEADLQPALKKITSTLDNNKKMLEKSYIKIPDNFVTWNETSFEKTLQKLCNVVDIEGLKGLDFKQLPIDNAPLYTYTPHLSCTNEHGFTNVTGYQGPSDDKSPNPSEHQSQKKNLRS